MLLGEIMESHSLHIFLLALPDFLGYPSAIAMTDRYAEDVKLGLKLKQFAHRVMEITSARMIHGENPIIGGFGRYPTDAELSGIKESAQELIEEAERVLNCWLHWIIPPLWRKRRFSWPSIPLEIIMALWGMWF